MGVIDERITLNVGGDIFETRRTTLKRFPKTLLGDEFRMLAYFCTNTGRYFFNRNRRAFEAILYFYQSDGDLRLPPDLRMEIFIQECQFYEIPKVYIDSMRLKAGVLAQTINRDKKEQKAFVPAYTWYGKIWDFLEKPETSKNSKIFAIFSFINILFSVVIGCVETVYGERVPEEYWQNPFNVAEGYLNSWFLFEVVIRFLFCPDKIKFFRTFLNIVDMIAVIPYFIILALKIDQNALSSLRLLRFVRVLRLFRLSKHSARIKAVGDILRDSLQDLYIFVTCLFIMTVFSGAILYFTEQEVPDTRFVSIPESMWWALQTVVTLGYGDITPISIPGKIYSSFFMVFGALTISLPVLSIVMKFTCMYSMDPDEEPSTPSKTPAEVRKQSVTKSREGSIRHKRSP